MLVNYMNWKEFKLQVESAGVTDSMEIEYIDYPGGFDTEHIDVTIENDDCFSVL